MLVAVFGSEICDTVLPGGLHACWENLGLWGERGVHCPCFGAALGLAQSLRFGAVPGDVPTGTDPHRGQGGMLRKQAAFPSWGRALRKPGSPVREVQLPSLRLAELWSLTPQSSSLQQHGHGQRVRFGCCKAWVDYKIISC